MLIQFLYSSLFWNLGSKVNSNTLAGTLVVMSFNVKYTGGSITQLWTVHCRHAPVVPTTRYPCHVLARAPSDSRSHSLLCVVSLNNKTIMIRRQLSCPARYWIANPRLHCINPGIVSYVKITIFRPGIKNGHCLLVFLLQNTVFQEFLLKVLYKKCGLLFLCLITP